MNKGGFSWKRATGVTRAKQKVARSTGIPLTKSGRQRKAGKLLTGGGCLLPTFALALVLVAAACDDGAGEPVRTATPTPSPTPVVAVPTVAPTAAPVAATPPPAPQPTVYYANCAEVRAAGAAPLRRGQPGYRTGLDRDGDGVACE